MLAKEDSSLEIHQVESAKEEYQTLERKNYKLQEPRTTKSIIFVLETYHGILCILFLFWENA